MKSGNDAILRIIPACAGNRAHMAEEVELAEDHPRMRGEQLVYDPFGGLMTGIIPACAGNSSPPTSAERRGWDHPRMRGEQTR